MSGEAGWNDLGCCCQGIDGLEGEALSHASAVLSDLQKEMAGRSVGPPEDGWKAWSQTFQQAGKIARAALEKEGKPPTDTNSR